jgi:twitching motility protein PilU
MVARQASDLFLSTGAPVTIKIDGISAPVNNTPLPPGRVREIASTLLNEQQIAAFEESLELDTAISVKDVGRFRINTFMQRGEVAMVVRYIPWNCPTVAELNLPGLLNDLVMQPRGMVIVVGATGSGKSSTLAAMIDHRNRNSTGHILTIEDPIEFIHRHRKSLVNQREIGLDTRSYAEALRRALREAPDVIMIGEIRDAETMQQALTYANTGHLCLSTLHATNADQAIERIISFFPETGQKQLLLDLSLNLRAVVAQRLLTGPDGKRLPATEILLNTAYIQSLIRDGDLGALKKAMEQDTTSGMQSFDNAILELYRDQKITLEEALANADQPVDLRLKISLGSNDVAVAQDYGF